MVFLARAQADPELEQAAVKERRRLRQERPQRILYAVGPGDVVGQYRALAEGREPPFQFCLSFTRQFLESCADTGATAHLISWHARRDALQVGRHRVENRPQPRLYYARGLKHYLGSVLYGLGIVAQAVRDRATVVIVDSGTTRWFVLAPLALLRIPVIAVMHSTLWPAGFPPRRRSERILRILDGFFFRRIAAATVCVSPECARQARAVAGKAKGGFYQFRPQYREDFLPRVAPVPPGPLKPLQVLFLGRVEEYKGVFLLVSAAERLEKQMPGQFRWRMVGGGEAFAALEARIRERHLEEIVQVEPMLPGEAAALEALSWSHVVVVPTTSKFKEGLAMTAVESVLAGRPVVVSSVVPAGEILGRAAMKAETDSVDSLVNRLCRLAQEPALYAEMQRATGAVQAQFYDRAQGLGNVLQRAIAELP